SSRSASPASPPGCSARCGRRPSRPAGSRAARPARATGATSPGGTPVSDAPRPVRAGPVNRLRWGSQHGVERLLAERGPAQLAAALAAIATLSLLTVADPLHRHESLREYRTIVVEPVAYYFLARYWLSDRALRALAVTAFLAGATAVALLAIGQVATGVHVVVAEGARRATSVYSHPNNLALYLARALPFALGLLLLSPPNPLRQRRLLLAAAIL